MHSLRALVGLPALIALTGCGLSHVMPPFSFTQPYAISAAGAPQPPQSLPASRAFAHHKKILREHDDVTDQTRVSVTTHRGTHFMWVQRPRVTFFYVYAGGTPAQTPPQVFLVFRTVFPQVPASNRLALSCDGSRQELDVTPIFWFEQGAFTTGQLYMYQLPLATLAGFTSCSQTSLAVGDVSAPFAPDQIEALRDFASRMR